MGQKVIYTEFLNNLDSKLSAYFDEYKDFICCKAGCSECCEKGDYPLSDIELNYLMQGYIKLDFGTKKLVQNNINTLQKGGACPFLINKLCSVYEYRPIICRVHGLAYLCKDNTVKVPYCVNNGKNFTKVYKDGEFNSEPIKENLDTKTLLKDFSPVIKNLYDWIKKENT